MSKPTAPDHETSAPWWDTESISSARAGFRRALQEKKTDTQQTWTSWMHFFIIGNARGLTRSPALCLAEMVASEERRGVRVEKCLTRHFLGGVTRMGFRALLALAEQVDVPLATIRSVITRVEALFAEDGCSAADQAALRLALAPRLGLDHDRADVSTLWDGWLEFRRREKEHNDRKLFSTEAEGADRNEKEEDSGFNAFCPAAAGQILAEALFALNDSEAALTITDQAANQDACIGPCGLAPQGMLSTAIIHLHRAGLVDRANEYAERLGRVAPVSHAWLLPAGARAWHLARMGRHEEAQDIIAQARSLAGNHETSAWHRMMFHHHAASAAALRASSGTTEPGTVVDSGHLLQSISLAAAFDERNGNDGVTRSLRTSGA